jgi:hypothetical protein
VAPAAFRIDEDLGVSVPLPPAAALDAEVLLEVVRGCPMRAIGAVDAGGRSVR